MKKQENLEKLFQDRVFDFEVGILTKDAKKVQGAINSIVHRLGLSDGTAHPYYIAGGEGYLAIKFYGNHSRYLVKDVLSDVNNRFGVGSYFKISELKDDLFD